jgi:HPt (histidine-containing phosphotransfer) domain-containing protein
MTETTIDAAVFAELQAAVGAEFVVELVETFAEEGPGMLAELRRAREGGEAERFRRAAHSLKSNALTFGASQLAEHARALEFGGIPHDAAPLAALDAAFADALAALRERARG